MARIVFAFLLFFFFLCSTGLAQTTSQGKKPKVIDGLFDPFQINLTSNESFASKPPVNSTKVKYISAFPEDILKNSSLLSAQELSSSSQAESPPQVSVEPEKEEFKVLQSK